MKNFNPETIQEHYRSGKDSLASDFFIPCLKASNRYRRAVAYFSTKALIEWSEIVNDILDNQLSIKLLLSPNLTEDDLEALKKLNDEQRLGYIRDYSEKFFERLESLRQNGELEKWRVEFFSWLVANNILTIKFAFPRGNELGSLFHEKIGVFDINPNYKIAFTGSANETSGGYSRNYESIDVYRNWIDSEVSRVETKENQFEEAWSGVSPGLQVHQLSEKVLNKIRSYSTSYDSPPDKPKVKEPESQNYSESKTISDTLWEHQKEAFDVFLEQKEGILEMATGTGKTRVAIAIMEHLLSEQKVDGAIVTVEGNPLLEQWQTEFYEWNYDKNWDLKIFGQYDNHRELSRFIRNPEDSVLFLSRYQLDKLFKHSDELNNWSLLIVHDEIHGFGSPSHVNNLKGSHEVFKYKLGLSATPEREYDEEGNEFIENEVGEIIYRFDLADAIEEGILCEFNYMPITYEVTEDDKRRIQAVYAKYKKKEELGEPYQETDKYRDLAMVYKTAENKIDRFERLVDNKPELLESCLIFGATKAYSERFLPSIHQHTHNYSTYFSGDEEYHLEEFADGNYDCLITCHKLSQGIDIPSVKNIVLLSSDRAKLETIQRIGRSLRIDDNNPDKVAHVYDFIGYNEGSLVRADKDRKEWLEELSQTKRQKQ
ncbi:DEAD/DEAH box helicase family protein [Fodinibius sp. AD559]|uniref:DEAD/DEAH box helicase family protein n=1 Tax=Fodinibius sp. AD559 TaxID=3424179 RepID=UPI004046E209